ncbi:DUF2691 family protein [Fictibacillus aquaticus]|uniref:DUF2691 domain-containing protein n=1 Tax=Fictibacillus aquaticus TaxID=2021314 RepID=A0A235F894_9BACL|nr:DUF2691 family protein [Fictibacillus aquaticus]OYD57207.1 hypothetical protein CGZ90_10975 [Fictibacillus aquaticus]
MIRGISFNIPNQYGSLLADILKPIDITKFNWHNTNEEAHIVIKRQLDKELFPETTNIMDGSALQNRITNNKYYVIFADLKAFPQGVRVHNIDTYKEFLDSECQLVLLIVDCVYTTIYCKNQEKLRLLYLNAQDNQFEDIQYITDENDERTRLSVW